MARLDLGRCWLVRRRRAPDGGGDVGIGQRQAVVSALRRRNVRESRSVHCAHEEIAGAVAGEYPAGSVGAMCRGSQAKDEHSRLRIAEARYRAAPIDVGTMGGLLVSRNLRAIRPQTFAVIARHDRVVNLDETSGLSAKNRSGGVGRSSSRHAARRTRSARAHDTSCGRVGPIPRDRTQGRARSA